MGVSSFRGLVATLGDFEATSTSVLGAYLAVGKDPETRLGTSTMRLRDVEAIHAPEATAVDIVGHVELKEMLSGGQELRATDSTEIGLLLPNGTFHTFTGNLGSSEAERTAQVQEAYNALKGPTDGSPHPMSDGRVVIKDASGIYHDDPRAVPGLPTSLRRFFGRAKDGWSEYVESVQQNRVEVVPIFSIDINRFASGSSRIKILTYR
jgi:hypothetical protein